MEDKKVIFVHNKVFKEIIRPDGRMKGYRIDTHDYFTNKKHHIFIPIKAEGLYVRKLGRNTQHSGWLRLEVNANYSFRDGNNVSYSVDKFERLVRELNNNAKNHVYGVTAYER